MSPGALLMSIGLRISRISIVKFLGLGSQIRQDPAYFNHWLCVTESLRTGCRQTCLNGGSCGESGRCECAPGFYGLKCQLGLIALTPCALSVRTFTCALPSKLFALILCIEPPPPLCLVCSCRTLTRLHSSCVLYRLDCVLCAAINLQLIDT